MGVSGRFVYLAISNTRQVVVACAYSFPSGPHDVDPQLGGGMTRLKAWRSAPHRSPAMSNPWLMRAGWNWPLAAIRAAAWRRGDCRCHPGGLGLAGVGWPCRTRVL